MRVYKTVFDGMYMPVIYESGTDIHRCNEWLIIILGIFLNSNPIYESQIPFEDGTALNFSHQCKMVSAFIDKGVITMDQIIKVLFPNVRIGFGHIPLIDNKFQPELMDFELYSFLCNNVYTSFAQDFTLYYPISKITTHVVQPRQGDLVYETLNALSEFYTTVRFDGVSYLFDERKRILASSSYKNVYIGPTMVSMQYMSPDELSRTVTVPLWDNTFLCFTAEKHDMLESLFRGWNVYTNVFTHKFTQTYQVHPSLTSLAQLYSV